MARPHIELDEHQLETLASIGCTLSEIAAFFKCSVDTITRNYAEVLYRGRENGKTSIRRMMWEHGKKGNSVALKYLVFNILKEKIEDSGQRSGADGQVDELMNKLSGISTEAILKIVRTHDDKAS